RSGHGQILYQRDQYHPRLHFHQHVSQDVGAQRSRVCPARRPADRAGHRQAAEEESHAIYAIKWWCLNDMASTTSKIVRYEEWLQMPEVEGREEVVDGEIIKIVPAKYDHSHIVQTLQMALVFQL